MGSHDMSVSSMQWQPALVKLSSAISPNEGTPVYIAPQHIAGIERREVQFSKVGGAGEQYPVTTCTYVCINSSLGYWVTESPDVIAMLRDRALGHEPPKPGVA